MHGALEELYPQQGHIQLLPGENTSSQHCFSPISLLVGSDCQVNTPMLDHSPSFPLCPSVSLSLLNATSVPTLSLSLSRQLDVGGSPLWKIQRGWKLLSCLALRFINHCLTDLLSLQTTPTSPKGTPGVAQSDSHYAEPQVRFPFTRTVRAVSRAQQSTAQHAGRQANASLAVSFRIYTRNREQARSSWKPRLPCSRLADGCCDDKQAGTVTGCEIHYLFFV